MVCVITFTSRVPRDWKFTDLVSPNFQFRGIGGITSRRRNYVKQAELRVICGDYVGCFFILKSKFLNFNFLKKKWAKLQHEKRYQLRCDQNQAVIGTTWTRNISVLQDISSAYIYHRTAEIYLTSSYWQFFESSSIHFAVSRWTMDRMLCSLRRGNSHERSGVL